MNSSRLIAFIDVKSNLDKSTLCANIAFELNRRTGDSGDRILVVDLDPQVTTTRIFSREKSHEHHTANLLSGYPGHVSEITVPIRDIEGISHGKQGGQSKFDYDRISLAPGSPMLMQLNYRFLREGIDLVIERARRAFADAPYDWIFLDCPNDLGPIASLGLILADGFVLPIRTEEGGWKYGLDSLVYIVELIRGEFNSDLRPYGAIMTQWKGSQKVSEVVRREVEEYLEVSRIPVFEKGLRQEDFDRVSGDGLLMWEVSGGTYAAMHANMGNLRTLTEEFMVRVVTCKLQEEVA